MDREGKLFVEKLCRQLADVGFGSGHEVMYLTPYNRSRGLDDRLVSFGFQGFCKDYLIERFNWYFFREEKQELFKEINSVVNNILATGNNIIDRLKGLYELDYLPLKIFALPEGIVCPVRTENGVPIVKLECTHDGFEWLVDWAGMVIADELLYPMKVASLAYDYRGLVEDYYEETSEASVDGAFSGFGFHKPDGNEELASAAFLTSFNRVSDTSGISYCKSYYGLEDGGFEKVMAYTELGDTDGLLDILVNRYPSGDLGIKLDSHKLWDVVAKLADSKVRDTILNRDGTIYLLIDRYDIEDVLCGKAPDVVGTDLLYFQDYCIEHGSGFYNCKVEGDSINEYYSILVMNGSIEDISRIDIEYAEMGLMEALWGIFSGTVNVKGYKVLDNHIRIGYCGKQVYWGESYMLQNSPFATDNVVFHAGITMIDDIEYMGYVWYELKPEFNPIFVEYNGKGDLVAYRDKKELPEKSILRLIFKDSNMIVNESMTKIRERLRRY